MGKAKQPWRMRLGLGPEMGERSGFRELRDSAYMPPAVPGWLEGVAGSQRSAVVTESLTAYHF